MRQHERLFVANGIGQFQQTFSGFEESGAIRILRQTKQPIRQHKRAHATRRNRVVSAGYHGNVMGKHGFSPAVKFIRFRIW
jgi:hypothetical protein